MPPSSVTARLRAQVERVCAAVTDDDGARQSHPDRTLRVHLVDALRRAIGFDAYAFVLTDPETAVGTSPLSDAPILDQLPRLIRLKYLTDVNRWTDVDSPPVRLLQASTDGDPARSRLWRELLREQDIGDVASIVFRDRYGCWGFLDLWRTNASGPFDAGEAAALTDVTDAITTALRHRQRASFVAAPATRAPAGPVVLLLSADLEVRSQTPSTQEYLHRLLPPDAGQSPVPACAYNVAAQLLAVEAGVDGHPAWARVQLQPGVWLTLRAARLGPPDLGDRRDIAVTLAETASGARLDLFARACGFTARETGLLGHLAAGADTRTIAGRTGLSEHTVGDHLKSMFDKAACRSRIELLARALGP